MAFLLFAPAAVSQGSGRVYYTDCNSTTTPTPFYEYDVATDQWTQKASIPTTNTTQLCADASGNVYCLPEDGMIYWYDPSADQWSSVIAGPSSSVGRNSIAMFETDQGEYYWASDGGTTLDYTVGGVWTSITTPRTISCASDVDRATGYLYIRTYGEMGYFVFDPATASFPVICDYKEAVSENGRCGVFYNGEFLDRRINGPYVAQDVTSCSRRFPGVGPTSGHSSSAVDRSGNIYSNGWNDDYLFEVYNIAANTITALAPAPDIPGNAHSTLVVSEGGALWRNYGQGFPGTVGIPGFVASNAPLIGQSITLTADNSEGSKRIGGFLVIGTSQIKVQGNWGGDLLASPDLWFRAVGIPVGGLVVSATIPADPTLVGLSVFLQVLEFDGGAALGISNTPGLELVFGQ